MNAQTMERKPPALQEGLDKICEVVAGMESTVLGIERHCDSIRVEIKDPSPVPVEGPSRPASDLYEKYGVVYTRLSRVLSRMESIEKRLSENV